jgi:hypothetical protein
MKAVIGHNRRTLIMIVSLRPSRAVITCPDAAAAPPQTPRDLRCEWLIAPV